MGDITERSRVGLPLGVAIALLAVISSGVMAWAALSGRVASLESRAASGESVQAQASTQATAMQRQLDKIEVDVRWIRESISRTSL